MKRNEIEIRCAGCRTPIGLVVETVDHAWGQEQRVQFTRMCGCFWSHISEENKDEIYAIVDDFSAYEVVHETLYRRR